MSYDPTKYEPRPDSYSECPECSGEYLHVAEFHEWVFDHCNQEGANVYVVPRRCEDCGYEDETDGSYLIRTPP